MVIYRINAWLNHSKFEVGRKELIVRREDGFSYFLPGYRLEKSELMKVVINTNCTEFIGGHIYASEKSFMQADAILIDAIRNKVLEMESNVQKLKQFMHS